MVSTLGRLSFEPSALAAIRSDSTAASRSSSESGYSFSNIFMSFSSSISTKSCAVICARDTPEPLTHILPFSFAEVFPPPASTSSGSEPYLFENPTSSSISICTLSYEHHKHRAPVFACARQVILFCFYFFPRIAVIGVEISAE